MTRVLVLGAGGRVGAAVCQAVHEDPELTLAAAVDPAAAGSSDHTSAGGVPLVSSPFVDIVASINEVDPGTVDVAVDFTVLEAARQNLVWCAAHGVHAVVGTSGFTEDEVAGLASQFVSSNCIVAPNFAIGAVLMMRFAELAAPFFPTAEIIELHHDRKIDAPSGTARNTLERMAAASSDWAPDPTEIESVEGARGGSGPGNIRVHSVRLRGLVAHQEVILGTEGETLTIRHDSIDRTSFMGGVLLACREIGSHPGVTLGLDSYMGL
jgi:4-hydroxy-tetrahydrodipicolinate reductase